MMDEHETALALCKKGRQTCTTHAPLQLDHCTLNCGVTDTVLQAEPGNQDALELLTVLKERLELGAFATSIQHLHDSQYIPQMNNCPLTPAQMKMTRKRTVVVKKKAMTPPVVLDQDHHYLHTASTTRLCTCAQNVHST